MKIYSSESVFDAALDRVRYLFDEFPEVICGVSGGKDSTVCLHLCLQVAREKGRLPLKVLWIDQEVEWQATVDFVESIMTMPDVTPMWFQMPMVITNNASSFERFNYCWRESDKEKWTHPKHPLAITNNRYGTDRFHELFEAIFRVEFANTRACYISGVRTEETPKRFVALTQRASYKWITWGKQLSKKLGHYTFYPIYDWSWSDVWKAIHDNGWQYNRIYDEMYRYGVPIREMRVSNLHHETAIQSLLLIQEIEPDTWVKVADRIAGANTIKHLKKCAFTCPAELPYMFNSWETYTHHLINNIIQDDKNRDAITKRLVAGLKVYIDEPIKTAFCQAVINSVLSSDWDWTKLANFEMRQENYTYRKWRKGDYNTDMLRNAKHLPQGAVDEIRRKLGIVQ